MADSASELARLKKLLLQPETSRLEMLQSQLGVLEDRLGTPKRLEAATAEILVDAFRQAETRQHRELARAVAPVVVAAIQSEIRNSRDMMVEALYPITGRLVAAAVANAFSTLVVSINERLDTMLSIRLWKLRVKSWVTRRPLSELLLADLTRPQLRRLLLLEKGSGVLLGAWPEQEDGDRSELVGGMIAAITEFSASAFEQGGGELRTIDMGSSRILLRSSARTIAAGEFAGPMRPQDERDINDEFERLISAHSDAGRLDNDSMVLAAQNLLALNQGERNKKKTGGLIFWLLGAVLLALVAVWGWKSWQRSAHEHGVRSAFSAAIAQHPQSAAYPLSLDFDHANRRILLSGLAPSQTDATAIRAAVAAQARDYALSSRVAIVASQDSVAQALESIRTRLDLASRELAGKIENSERRSQVDMQAQMRAIEAINSDMAKLGEAMKAQGATQDENQRKALQPLAAQLKTLNNIAAGPSVMAVRFMRENAIFFLRDAALRNGALADKQLDELANLLRAAGQGVRIVGYSSGTGSIAKNAKLAEERANLVRDMLVKRGISEADIVVAIRPSAGLIDIRPDGDGNANRRVEFEPLFLRERQDQ